MSIKSCPNCIGLGWFPGGNRGKCGSSALHTLEDLPPGFPELWERCWCNYGIIGSGQPAFWKDRERVQQVFFNPYEDIEKAVLSFLKSDESDQEHLKILKFYIAQWVVKDPYPPPEWLDRLSETTDWLSLKKYVAWLGEHLIIPF